MQIVLNTDFYFIRIEVKRYSVFWVEKKMFKKYSDGNAENEWLYPCGWNGFTHENGLKLQ